MRSRSVETDVARLALRWIDTIGVILNLPVVEKNTPGAVFPVNEIQHDFGKVIGRAPEAVKGFMRSRERGPAGDAPVDHFPSIFPCRPTPTAESGKQEAVQAIRKLEKCGVEIAGDRRNVPIAGIVIKRGVHEGEEIRTDLDVVFQNDETVGLRKCFVQSERTF